MKSTITRLPVLAALVCLVASAPAQAADLLEVFQRARQRDAVYAAARSAWAASREKLPQGRALLLPSATLSANTNYNDRTIDFRSGVSSIDKYGSHSVSAAVTQPLYRPQSFVQFEQAKVQLAQADAQLASAAQELILRVAQAYFDVLLARDNVELARSQKTAIAEQFALAKKSFDLGTTTATDLHEAQARHDLVSAQEVAARNELESRRRVLQQILDSAAPDIAPLREGFTPPLPEPNNMESWVEIATRNSPQVQAQAAASEFAEKEVQRNRAAHWPTVDLVVSHIRSTAGSGIQGGVGLDTVASGVGLQLAVPLYQGGAISSRSREAVANLSRANDELDNARRTAALIARQAFLGVSLGVEQISALRSAITSSQRQLSSSQYGRKVGVRTIVDVLNTQQQLYSTRRDLSQAIYTYILNDLRLRLAAGTLSESDVARVNAWLAPAGAESAAQLDARETTGVVSRATAGFTATGATGGISGTEEKRAALGLRLALTLSEDALRAADAKAGLAPLPRKGGD
ncbi:MAG TPA: TolC family outer membrane protein [Burkholderiales bacterium]|nr:TolC family outer membrane protein [Burkholderiales bacterium]